jgi:Anthrone oxygenase
VDALIDLTGLVALLAAATLAGGQVFCALAILPALPEFPPEMSVRVHQRAMTFRPHRYLRIAGAVAILSGTATLILIIVEDDTAAAIVLVAIGVATSIISAVMSSREWPINEEITSWEGREPDLDRYAVLRAKWDRQHYIRTVLSVTGLVCFALAALVSHEL